MLRFTYPVKLTPDRKDGGYVVTCRDIPEAITQGETTDEALAEAEGALQAAIEGRIEDGLDIPAPSQAKRGERLAATPITVKAFHRNVDQAGQFLMAGAIEKSLIELLDVIPFVVTPACALPCGSCRLSQA